MRIATFLLCCLPFLAVIAAAQTSATVPQSQSGNSSNPGLQTGDINQATQNPLASANQNVQNQSTANKPQAATFDVGNEATAGQDQMLGEVRLMSGYSEIGGDTTRSFHTPGANDLAEFNYFEDHRFMVNHRLQVLSSFRATDDQSIDPEHDSLQRGYVRLYGPKDEVIVGDTLVNYSRLSFNQNIKGLSDTFRLGDNWKVSDVAGVFIDRWGSLYKPFSALPGRPYLSFVAGARIERKLSKNSALGFNFSSSNDEVDSLPQEALGTAPEPARNRVGSIDSRLAFGRVRLDSEFAYSFTDFDIRRSSAGCAEPCDTRSPQAGVGMQSDWGGRLEASWRYKRLNLRESYVRYQPNFASINARQISDLQDDSFRASYDLTDWLVVDGTLRRSNNDLRRQLAFETTFWGPEAHFLLHDLSLYKHGTLEFGYRHRDVEASNLLTPVSGNPPSQNVRIPYVELGIPVRTAVFTLGYERQNFVDNVDSSQSNNNNRLYAGVRGVFDLGGWHVNPNMRFELNRESHRPGLPTDPLLLYDSNRLSTIGFYVEAPSWFIMEFAYRDSSATITSLQLPAATITSQQSPAGFSRPSYKAAITYKIRNDENTRFIFAFERNSNFYSPDTLNYDERIWSGTVVYRFSKRGQ